MPRRAFRCATRGWRSAWPGCFQRRQPRGRHCRHRLAASAEGADTMRRCARPRFDLAKAALPLGLPPGVSGTTSVATDVAGRGRRDSARSWRARRHSAINVANGAVPLFGIAESRPRARRPRNAARGQLAAVTGAVSARASPSAATAAASAVDGTAIIAGARYFSAEASGRIGLLDGALDLPGTVTPVPGAGAGKLFAVGGTLGEAAGPRGTHQLGARARSARRARLGRQHRERARRSPRCRSGWWRWR